MRIVATHLFVLLLMVSWSFDATSQRAFDGEIDWSYTTEGRLLLKQGAPSELFPGLQVLKKTFALSGTNTELVAVLSGYEEEQSDHGVQLLLQDSDLPEDYAFNFGVLTQRKLPVGFFKILPLRRDSESGKIFRMTKYQVKVFEAEGVKQPLAKEDIVNVSQLAEGEWFKIGVDTSGVFKITYDNLRSLGFSDPISSAGLRVHGYGKGMLPESNAADHPDDLPEVPVQVVDGGDGEINAEDYVLFFAEGPDEWVYNEGTERFYHKTHIYADTNYYFLTEGSTPGKRIANIPQPSGEPTIVSRNYDYLIHHEKDLFSIINSGRRFAGEKFDLELEYSFNYQVPDIVLGSEAFVYSRLIARSTRTSSFTLNADANFATATIPSISTSQNAKYAQEQVSNFTFEPKSADLTISYSYNKTNSSSVGWLDFFSLNIRRKLSLINGQMIFRDGQTIGNELAEYRLLHDGSLRVWDVTDIHNIRQMTLNNTQGGKAFKQSALQLREFVAFDGSNFLTPELFGKVGNQNLHSYGSSVNYVIITPEIFKDQATRLAQFHRENSDLNVRVVELQKIYNEFSSGMQDVSAIRNFLKMMYDRSPADGGLQYVLLFGDGSFDYKDVMENNTNLVPTYQTPNSLHPVTSYATDDFFGYLDDDEGDLEDDMLDVGLGRLPVMNKDQAARAVDKIINYGSNSDAVLGAWRNIVTFIGDDQDSNSHLDQANDLANYVNSNHPEYNLVKIFFDAYPQQSTPGGQRYPTVTENINTRVQEGALIVNYTGHGGEVGLAHERVLGVDDIENWSNYDRLPVFVTATCEFSRFDDPERVSAGEMVFTHPHGGGIALFTTTRATYGNPNFNLNRSFYTYALSKVDGRVPRMGDLIRLAKRDNGGGSNGRKFILLGDPALQMAYPKKEATITHINGQSLSVSIDTLKALSEVTMQGIINDENGEMLTNFNGIVYPTIYDKKEMVTTLANDPDSYPYDFEVLNSILYKGKAEVVDGAFEFSFIVPKDIDYNFGRGKVSLYAAGDHLDAHGYSNELLVGGFEENVMTDAEGPSIALFINDPAFESGGLTGPNPVLYATISDQSGVNTVGNGIGHDLVAYIDNTEDVKVLNDYYQSNLNTYKSGTVEFPFFNVDEGEHTLYIKAWDVFNNSAEAQLDFVVVSKDKLAVQRAGNYPNPVINQTLFTFEHNQKNTNLLVELEIFDMFGRKVHYEKHQQFTGNANKIEPIPWSGENTTGSPLKKGVYIYKIRVSTEENLVAEETKKLLLIR